MKILLKLFTLFIVVFVLYSCEEDFNPNAEFRDIFVMNCVLRGDTAVQTAVVSKNYFVEGLDPNSNTTDPAIKGADIRIWYKDTVYKMRDTVISRNDTSRYKTDYYYYYYVQNFRPDYDQPIEIEAVLPNGKRLKSATRTPGEVELNADSTDFFIPSERHNYLFCAWRNSVADLIHSFRLRLIYDVKTENGTERRYKNIPMDYYVTGDSYIPLYPNPSKTTAVTIKQSAVDRAMAEISEGDPNKGNYTIYLCLGEIVAFDKSLSAYYASTNQVLDQYSVRLDQIDVTNIVGGYGLFASITKKNFSMFFEGEYIRSFGYVPKF